MHPTQVGQWKRELQEQAAGLLEVKRGVRPVDPSASPDRLYAEIGRLKMELDWLKKKVRGQPLGDRKRWVGAGGPLPLARQCALAGVAHSTVYAPRRLAEPDPEELALLALIDEEYTRHPFYGSRKTVIHLEQMGHRVNVPSGSGG